MSVGQEIMTTQEVASYLRTSKKIVHRMVGAGELPVNKIRKMWRFKRSDVEALFAGQNIPQQATAGVNK